MKINKYIMNAKRRSLVAKLVGIVDDASIVVYHSTRFSVMSDARD